MSFTVKSITDVITNSSTEVFTVVNKGTVDDIKKMINLILLGTGKTWEDLYEKIELEYDFDWLGDCYDEEENDKPWDELTEAEKISWSDSHNEDAWENAIYPSLKLTPAPRTSDELTKILERIGNSSINHQYACYC